MSNLTLRETSPLLPTLSTKGWVAGIAEKIDMIYAYYLTSQYSQTVYHAGHVRSLAYITKKYYTQPDQLASALKTDIETLLTPYVDYVYCEVTFEEREDRAGCYDFTILVTIQHAGFVWETNKAIRVKDSVFEKIVNINNEGKPSLS